MFVYTAEYIVPVSSPPVTKGGIAVSDGLIMAVGTAAEVTAKYPSAKVKDFGKAAIVPGFVNCHTHLELTAFRGALDAFDHDFCKWLVEITRLRKEHAAVDEIGASALLGACEAAASGVTAVGDIGRIGNTGAEALEAVGLRGVVFQETEFSPDDATADIDFDQLREKFEALCTKHSGNVSIGISPHAPYTVSRKLFEKITGYSVDNEILISIHAAESQAESELMKNGAGVFFDVFFRDSIKWKVPHKSTISYFSDIGVLDAAPLLAHCIDVTEKEIDLIAESGSRVAHCPVSNAKFGHGIAPLGEFLKKGVDVGLGTDSMASNNRCDLLGEARIGGLLSRVLPNGASFIEPETLFRIATLGGAAALGMDEKVGSLETGKQADLAVISVDGVGQTPVTDIFSVLVFSTDSSSVETVMVAGEVVYDNGELTKVDTEELQTRVSRSFG